MSSRIDYSSVSGLSNASCNLGLLYYKYLKNQKSGTEQDGREELFKQIKKLITMPLLNTYRSRFEQWKKIILNSNTEKRCVTLKTQSPLVIGLGDASPFELGLTFHHTYGLPMIPGSALKGVTAHYCNKVLGAIDDRFLEGSEIYSEMFGNENNQAQIIFHDAFITPSSLKPDMFYIDIMTPHHQNYYSNHKIWPEDDESPNPIKFLTVSGNFWTCLVCKDNSEKGKKILELTFQIFEQAIEQQGVGGKTNSGYGQIKLEQ